MWRALPVSPITKIIVSLIIIGVIICACTIVVLAEYYTDLSNDTISGYVSSISGSSSGSGNSSGAKMYKETGSLLLMKDSDIKEISKSYLKETESKNYSMNLLMKKEYGSGSESTGTAVSVDEKKVLYEHFLNTEKYNFNKIKWVKYNRSKEEGTPDMQVDSDTRLQYPKDNKNTTLQTFANMFQPYLQHYIIPYSLYSGLITDSRIKPAEITEDNPKELMFGYQMIKNMYHDIRVNQYNMQSYTKVTEQTVYDIYKVNLKQTIEYKDGNIVNITPLEQTLTLDEACHPGDIQVISETTQTDVRYCLKYAKTFDKYIINEWKYTEYNLSNEPDDQTISRTIYRDEGYKAYEEGTLSLPTDKYNFEYDENGQVVDGTYTLNYDYIIRKGYTDTTTSTWKDLLDQVSHEERAYKVDDIQDAIGSSKLSNSEKEYYKEYEYNSEGDKYLERLNTFDIVNAQKNIYTNYLRDGEEYSENIGYPRSWMRFSLYTLKQSMKDLASSENGWKYFYGSSMEMEEATSVDTQNSSSSSSLVGVDYSSLPEGKLGWPVPGHTSIASGFRTKARPTHQGIDISAPMGATFVASAAGEVIAAHTACTDNYGKPDAITSGKTYCGGNAGNYVKIKIDNSNTTITYMHLTEAYVKVGDKVKAGQPVGTCGTTGRSTGTHAHYEVRVNNTPVDPCGLFDQNYCGD